MAKKSFIATVKANLKKTANRQVAKDYAIASAAGFAYPLIPTVIEKLFKVDLTGWKGFLTGGILNILIGMVTGQDAYVAGTVSSMSSHLFYAQGNELVKKTLGKYLFRFDPTEVATFADAGNGLNPGAVPYRLPDGSTVPLYSTQQVRAQGMSDYSQASQPLSDYSQANQPLADFTQAGQPLSDFTNANDPLSDAAFNEFALDSDPYAGQM